MDDDVRLVELASVIRLALRRRTSDQHLVEDMTQDTMLRVAAAQPHLEPHALRAYAIVTARNGLNTHLRNQSIARRHAHRVVDYTTLVGAEELTLEHEETNALAQALDALDEADRRLLLDHEVEAVSVATLAARDGTSSGAMAMRLARARALLRVEFLLAFRRVKLDNDHCRHVLLAISAGDQRRQRAIGAAEHLLTCEDCSELSQPLIQRRRGAAAWWFLPVPAWMARLGRRLRTSRPAQAGAAIATAAAIAIVVVVLVHGEPPAPAASPPAATAVAPAAALAATTIDTPPPAAGTSPAAATTAASTTPATAGTTSTTTPAAAGPSTTAAAAAAAGTTTAAAVATAPTCPPPEALPTAQPSPGCPYTLTDVVVTDVPANEGFWITFTDGAPMWVHLVGPGESPQHIVRGDHVTLTATVAAVSPVGASGVPDDQTAQLERRSFYLSVAFADLQVTAPG